MAWDQAEKHELIEHLQTLADYYGARLPSGKAIELWVRSLSSESPARTLSVLDDWPKMQRKMPTIAEVREAVGQRYSHELEAQALSEAKTAPRLDRVRPADPAVARAYDRFMQALGAAPKRNARFWEQHSLMHVLSGRKFRDGQGIWREISSAKRDHIRAVYGDQPDPAAVESARQAVNAQLQAERSLPRFADLLAEERARGAA